MLQTPEKTPDRSELELRLMGYRMATIDVLYHLPDHPGILQNFIWQTLDLAPQFPRLNKFLQFWKANIDGEMHKVTVATRQMIEPQELRCIDGEFRLH
ncbi:MAG: Usg family protein [Pseudomonadota bacterium]